MSKRKKTALLGVALIIAAHLQAQVRTAGETGEQTGFMRSEAKIYVVMVVVITILAGLLAYLARLDRKINKLEKGENV
jgi:uncharacterized protein YycO